MQCILIVPEMPGHHMPVFLRHLTQPFSEVLKLAFFSSDSYCCDIR